MDIIEFSQLLKQRNTDEIVEQIKTIDPFVVDKYENTLLHLSAQYASSVAVSWCLEQGIDCWASNKYNYTALRSLCEARNEEAEEIRACAILLLKAGCPIEQRDESGNCFYHVAAMNGIYPLFEAMKECHILPEQTISTGENVLHLLCHYVGNYSYLADCPERQEEESKHFTNSVKLLLGMGMDPEATTNIGRKAIDFALESKAYHIAVLLKQEGEDELHLQAKGMNLHQASIKNDRKAIEALIALGADIDELSEDSQMLDCTALMCACRVLAEESIATLIENNAKVDYRSGTTQRTAMIEFITALDKSYRIQRRVDVELIMQIARLLLADTHVLNQRIDEEENTALLLMCKNMNRSWWADSKTVPEILFPYLIQLKADLHMRNTLGQNAAHLLCLAGGERSFIALERCCLLHVHIDEQDKDGNTPLHLASLNRNQSEALTLVKILCRFHANPQVKNNEGYTASEIAAKQGYEQVMLVLLNEEENNGVHVD